MFIFTPNFQIVEYANNKEFTSIIVVHTSRREPGYLSSIFHSFPKSFSFDLSSFLPFLFLFLQTLFAIYRCSLDNWIARWAYSPFEAFKSCVTQGSQGVEKLTIHRL